MCACEKIVSKASFVLSVLSLVLLIAFIGVLFNNRSLQEEVGARQAQISAATNLASLNQGLAQALAEVAVTKGDAKVKELLDAQGIKYNAGETAKNAADPSAKKK